MKAERMQRFHFLALSAPLCMLLIGAGQPVEQVGASQRSSDGAAAQIDRGDAKAAQPAAIDQAADRGKPAASTDQLTDTGRQAQPGDQLVGREKGATVSPQLADSQKTAEASEPLTARAEGRNTKVLPVEGRDRCDEPAESARQDDVCANAIETRAGEFTRPDPLVLSPEQRLLAEQPQSPVTGSFSVATRRLAEEGEPLSMTEQGLAATAYDNRVVSPGPGPEEPKAEAIDFSAIGEAMANLPQGQ